MSHIRPWGVGPGGPAVLGEAVGYASAPGRYQLECEPFFGPPPGEILPGPRDQPREMWGLPDAYRNQRLPYVANTIIRLLTQFQNSWVTSRVLPLKEQQDLKIEWTVIEFDRTLAEFEPELGVPRLATLRRRQEGAYMTRHGMALEVNHGYAATPQGRDDWMLKLRSITGAVQETMDQAGIMALVQAADYYYKSVMKKISSYPTLLGAYDESCKTFGAVQFRPRFWHEMHTDGEMMMSLENVVPDTWIVPLGLQTWASLSDSLEVNADKAGVAVARHNIENGYKAFLNFRGCTVHGARPVTLDQDGRTIEPLVRHRTIGKGGVVSYYRLKEIVPGGAVCPVHADGRTQLFIPAEDDWHTFTWLDVYRQSNVAQNLDILNEILGYGDGAATCIPSDNHDDGRVGVPTRAERPLLAISCSQRSEVPSVSRSRRSADGVPPFVSKAMQMAIEQHEGVDFKDAAAAAAGWASKFAQDYKCSDEAARAMHKRNLDHELVKQLDVHHGLSKADLDEIQEQAGDYGVDEAAAHLFNAYLRGDGKSNALYRSVTRNSSGRRDRASVEAMRNRVVRLFGEARDAQIAVGIDGRFRAAFDRGYDHALARNMERMTTVNDDVAVVFTALTDVQASAASAAVGTALRLALNDVSVRITNQIINHDHINANPGHFDRMPVAVRMSPQQTIEYNATGGAGDAEVAYILAMCQTLRQNRSIDPARHAVPAPAPALPASTYRSMSEVALTLARWFTVGVEADTIMSAGLFLADHAVTHQVPAHAPNTADYEQDMVRSAGLIAVCQWLRGVRREWTDDTVRDGVREVVTRALTSLESQINGGLGIVPGQDLAYHIRTTSESMYLFARAFVEVRTYVMSSAGRRLTQDQLVNMVADTVVHTVYPSFAHAIAAAAGDAAAIAVLTRAATLTGMMCVAFTCQMMCNAGRGRRGVHASIRNLGGPIIDRSFAFSSAPDGSSEDGNRTKDHERMPFDWLLARTTEEYMMGTAILCKAGLSLGCSYYGHQDFMMSDDAQAKKHFGHFTIWTASVIHDPSQMAKFHDVFCVRYIAGGGSQILSWDQRHALHQDVYAAFRDNHASILAIPVPVGAIDIEDNSWSMRNPIDLSNALDSRFSTYLGENCEDRVDIGDYMLNAQNTFDAMHARWTYLPPAEQAKVNRPVVPDYPAIWPNDDKPGHAWSARIAKAFGFDNSNPMAAIAAADSDFHKSAFIRNSLIHMGGHRLFDDKKKMWRDALENTGHFGSACDRRGTLRLRNGHYGLATELPSGLNVLGVVH